MNIKGSKHLTLGERIAIYELLVQNKSLNEIAEAIHKDARTISKEVKRNRQQEINIYLFMTQSLLKRNIRKNSL